MPTSLKSLADPRVVRVAPELYRLPSVATRVPLDGRVVLQSVRTVAPAPVPPPAPATRMVPPLFLLMRPPRPTVPLPRPESTTPAPGEGFTEVNFPLPRDWPNPVALPRWRVRIESTTDRHHPNWDQQGHITRVWLTKRDTYYYGLYDVIWSRQVNCFGQSWEVPNNAFGDGRNLRIISWELIGFVPCPGRRPVHPEVLPLVEPERPQPEWIPFLPRWVPALPEIQPEPEEPEEPEEEAPLPIPLPLPLPGLPPAVPEVPVEVPSEKETERRLAPVPVEVPQIDPQRSPVPATAPQTQPYPWKVEPQRPVVVPVADPLPRPAPPTTLPPTQTPATTRPQVVPATTTVVIEAVRQAVERIRRTQLTVEVQSQPETYKVSRTRVKTDEKDPDKCECCEELECLKIWCQNTQWSAAYYKGEWREDEYAARQYRKSLVIPNPLKSLADYLNERLADLKKEICEAIDLLAFIDKQPEPFTDRRKHGRQWQIYWGRRKRGEQSMKTLTLPEVGQRISLPPEPPPIYDGKICLHYGLNAVTFWGRIWVGRSSADALESYLREIYGDSVQFTRSENENREYRRGRLIPTRARYWNGQKWLPPQRWQPRQYERN